MSVGVSVVASVVMSSSSRTGRKSTSFNREPSRTPKAGLSSRKPSDIILDISPVNIPCLPVHKTPLESYFEHEPASSNDSIIFIDDASAKSKIMKIKQE